MHSSITLDSYSESRQLIYAIKPPLDQTLVQLELPNSERQHHKNKEITYCGLNIS